MHVLHKPAVPGLIFFQTLDIVDVVNLELVKEFINKYNEGIEQGDKPNNLREMGSAADLHLMLKTNLYIRGLLFNESDVYAPYNDIPPVTRAERVAPARNISQLVMQTFRSSMQRIPLDVINSRRLREYYEVSLIDGLDSFLNGLYAEVEKALDDAVAKLSNDTAPSYHRQLCTAKNVDEQMGCEFAKAVQVFVMACDQPEPSIVPEMRSRCENEPTSDFLSPCVLDEAPGPTYIFDQLFKASDILRIRLFHLVFVYTLCDGQYSRGGWSAPLESLPKAIEESFLAAFTNAKLRYWPNAAVEAAKILANESGPFGYPTENDARKYSVLAKQIAEKISTQWNISDLWSSFLDPEYKALVYYDCDDCTMVTDKKWINVETDEQRKEREWSANETRGQLGIAKHAGVNIVLYRPQGGRYCMDQRNRGWMKEISSVISNAVKDASNSASLLEVLDQALTPRKGEKSRMNWRASDGGCFRAILAIRCAHRFVWLELAWKYFPATSDTPYKVDVDAGSYRYVTAAQCMRVVLIE